MRVVVTGGAGFIGGNLVRELAADQRVTGLVALDDLSTGSRANLGDIDQCLVEGSILDGDLLDSVLTDCDTIVHLAARPSVPRSVENPIATHDVNVNGTLRVLEAARRIGRPQVIVASSSSVYGSNPALPKTETLATVPRSPYAASKLATEAYALAYGACFDLPVLAFRFFNVFGPLQSAKHDYAAVVPAFVDAALLGKPLPVHGDGLQSRDFTYVGSVAAVIADAIDRRIAHPEPVNLAFGSRRTLLDVIGTLETVLGHDLKIEHQAPRAGDVRHSQADQARLRSLFPDVKPVDFEQGIRETVAWFRSLD